MFINWMLYAWTDLKKSPVPEFQSLAKCDWRIDQVGDAREGWVIGMGRVESMGSNETK